MNYVRHWGLADLHFNSCFNDAVLQAGGVGCVFYGSIKPQVVRSMAHRSMGLWERNCRGF